LSGLTEGETTPSRRPLHVSSLAFVISLFAVAASWTCTGPLAQWWREQGFQLPSVSELWLTLTWHLVAAAVVAGSALIIRIRGGFGWGVGIWGAIFILYVVITGLAMLMPMFPPASIHG
jgi:hypothetical protein